MRRIVPLAAGGMTLLASLGFSFPVSADIIYLKDGSKVEGEVLRKSDAGWIVKTPDGKTANIEAAKVKSFEARRGGVDNADDTMRDLVSLRRSVENQTDIEKVLERYRKFVEQNVGTPAADQAMKDLQVWEDRRAQGMTRLGEKWMTKQEQEALVAKAAERALAARELLLQGRMKDAMAELDSAVVENPQNAAAHYLRGVILHRQDQKANARKSFETSLQLSPNHGPSLNNIAVIMWDAKQLPGAINFYGQAMNASPNTRLILDNVAEALHDLPETQRDNAATKKVVLMFNAQDMTLQGKMKQRGMFRWGSTWVEEKALDKLKKEEERIEERLDVLEEDFEEVQDRMEEIDRDVADTERSIRRIEASSYGRDSQGRVVRLSYPRLYYDLKRDLEQLHIERDNEKEKASRLRSKAKQVQQELSVPRYTGTQQIIGADGSPDLPVLTDADEKVAPAAG